MRVLPIKLLCLHLHLSIQFSLSNAEHHITLPKSAHGSVNVHGALWWHVDFQPIRVLRYRGRGSGSHQAITSRSGNAMRTDDGVAHASSAAENCGFSRSDLLIFCFPFIVRRPQVWNIQGLPNAKSLQTSDRKALTF